MSPLTQFRATACAVAIGIIIIVAAMYGFPRWTLFFILWMTLSSLFGLAISSWQDKLRRLKAQDVVRHVVERGTGN
jgi:hypothetical protein